MRPFRICDVLKGSHNTDLHPAFIVNSKPVKEILISPTRLGTNRTFDQALDLRSEERFDGISGHLFTNAEWAAFALWCKRYDKDMNGYGTFRGDTVKIGEGDYYMLEWVNGLKLDNGKICTIKNNNAAANSTAWQSVIEGKTIKYAKYGENTRFSAVSTDPVATGADAEILQSLAIIPEPTEQSEKYGSSYFWASASNEIIALRGNAWHDSHAAGAFALYLYYSRAYPTDHVGFCSAFLKL